MEREDLNQAISLILAGQKEQARLLIKPILTANPHDQVVWLWFIQSLPNDDARYKAVQLWLKMDPANQIAQDGLDRVKLELRKLIQAQTSLEPIITASPESIPNEEVPTDQTQPKVTTSEIPITNRPSQPSVFPKKISPRKKPISTFSIILIACFFIISMTTVGSVIAARLVFGLDIFSIIFPPSSCHCSETDSYMVRVADRIRKWQTNQSLLLLSNETGGSTGNLDLADQIFQEEEADIPPECLSTIHDLMLSLLTHHKNYAQALSDKNSQQASYFLVTQQLKQEALQKEFTRINLELQCTK